MAVLPPKVRLCIGQIPPEWKDATTDQIAPSLLQIWRACQVRELELPQSDLIWEASRFGCDRDIDSISRRHIVSHLILGCQEFGIANGISRYLGVMPTWVFKYVIAANGCPVTYIGPKLRQYGHEIAAAYIDISPSILEAVRSHTGIREPLLEPKLTLVA